MYPSVHYKDYQYLHIEENFTDLIKNNYDKSTMDIILNGDTFKKVFPTTEKHKCATIIVL